MPRVDDYAAALALAADQLKSKDPRRTAQDAGATFDGRALRLAFLGQEHAVTLEPFAVRALAAPDKEVPLTDQVLLVHYLAQANGRGLQNKWIAFREIPGADAYHPVFYKRAAAPLLAAFGHKPELLAEVAADLPCKPGDTGDASIIVQALPHVPLMMVLWRGDEEFPPEAAILFDGSLPGYLTAEDAAWLAGRVVYPLAAKARALGGRK